jgi:hypothetical protein
VSRLVLADGEYWPLETATRPAGAYFDDEASPAQALHRAQVLHRAQAGTVEGPLPRPKAIDCVVFADTATRTLSVRPGDQAGGYEKAIWREAWSAQRRAQEAGWPPTGSQWLWADVAGAPRAVHGLPAEGGVMAFTFPVGTAGFGTLISKPGLVALVSLDISTREFLTCRFTHRPG